MVLDISNLERGSSVKISIDDGDSEEIIVVRVLDTEWTLSRKPFAINFEIDESSDYSKWPTKSKILLGFDFIEDEFYKFLLKCPNKLQPNKILHCDAKMKFLLN